MKKSQSLYTKAIAFLKDPPYTDGYNQGVELLKKAADLGHAKAQYNLGVHLHQVVGAYEEAYPYFEKAANQDILLAHHMLGCYYSAGFLTPPSLEKALYHFRYAAQKGVADSQYNAGVLLLCEKETTEEGFQYFVMAAEQNHCDAQYNLGVCFAQGIGTAPSRNKAIHYLELAVKQKHPKAAKALETILMATNCPD